MPQELKLDTNIDEIVSFTKSQRWFRKKNSKIKNASIVDYLSIKTNSKKYLLLIIKFSFNGNSSDEELYFIPLITNEETGQSVKDALIENDFKLWLVESAYKNLHFQLNSGIIEFKSNKNTKLSELTTTVNLSSEQTNTSFIVDKKLIVKIFRRLEDGENLEFDSLEILKNNSFQFSPSIVGEINYKTTNNKVMNLGIIQNYIENDSDGWTYTTSILNNILKDLEKTDMSLVKEKYLSFFQNINTLGKNTALMHKNLIHNSPSFASEEIKKEDINLWSNRIKDRIKETISLLSKKGIKIQNENWFLELTNHLNILSTENIHKIRIHGDYHLGQTLIYKSDFYILDFEGEPLKSIQERKEKYTIFKDIAGMTRSFSYAVNFVIKENNITNNCLILKTKEWEELIRNSFLESYFEECKKMKSDFISKNKESNYKLLKFFEVEKAFYELNYELNYRPDWLNIPLEFIYSCTKTQ